jgi:hypothetical protein
MQTANAIRVQRCYRRQLAGRGVLSIEVDLDALAADLIADELLDPSQADDRDALAKALERAVAISLYSRGFIR